MPATTLILNPGVEQGEQSRASKVVAEVKQKMLRRSAKRELPESFEPESVEQEEEIASPQAGHSRGEPDHLFNAGERTVWSDFQLIQAFQCGDEFAFAELYTRHKREVYTFCVRMMAGDRDLANDAFQEIFIKVYEKGASFRTGENVLGWLYMIARNTCLNLHRSKHANVSLDEGRAIVSNDRSLSPEYGEEQHFLREVLEHAIEMLAEEYREPFILREFDGFSYGEIAKMLGTTLSLTKIRIYRAKKRLRELLQPYLEMEESEGLTRGTTDVHAFIDKQDIGPELLDESILNEVSEEDKLL